MDTKIPQSLGNFMTEEELDRIQLFNRVIFVIPNKLTVQGYVCVVNYSRHPSVHSIEICYNKNYNKNEILEISRADALQYLSFCYATFYDWIMETTLP